MSGVRIKNVQKKELKDKFVVLKVVNTINLIKLVVIMAIGVVWVAVNNGGTKIRLLA